MVVEGRPGCLWHLGGRRCDNWPDVIRFGTVAGGSPCRAGLFRVFGRHRGQTGSAGGLRRSSQSPIIGTAAMDRRFESAGGPGETDPDRGSWRPDEPRLVACSPLPEHRFSAAWSGWCGTGFEPAHCREAPPGVVHSLPIRFVANHIIGWIHVPLWSVS